MPKRLIVIALAAAGSLALVLLAFDLTSTEAGISPAVGRADEGTTSSGDRPVVPLALAVEDQAPEVGLLRAEETRAAAATEADAYEEELAAAAWVEGRVIFPTGTPADEQVFVLASGLDFEHGPEHRAEVAADGSFRSAFARGTVLGNLRLEARYLYLEDAVRVDLGEEVLPLVLEPRLGGRIEGQLVLPSDGDLSPEDLDGGKLELERTVRTGTWTTMGTCRTLSVQGLTFEFEAIPLGAEYRIELDAEVGYGRQLGDLSIAAGETSAILVEVRPGVALEGRVLDEQGSPVPEVEVTASAHDMGSGISTWREATTGGDGAYVVRGLSPGTLTLGVEADGFAPTERELLPAAEGETIRGVDIVLERGLEIGGRVLWPDGTPAPGAAIGVHRRPPGAVWFEGTFEETFKAGEDGSFVVTGLPDATYRVSARAERGEAHAVIVKSPHTDKEHTIEQRATWHAEADDVPAGTSGLELVLDAGATVVGVARDDLGRPLDAFEVEATMQRNPHFQVPHFSRFRQEGVRRSFHGTGGRFELEGLTVGSWSIAAKAPGHAASEGRVLHVPGDPTEAIELLVPRAGRIEGRVVDPAGRGVSNARVVLGDRVLPFGDSVTTDDSGAFVLEEVPPGAVALQAEAEHDAPSEPLVVQLEPGALVTGVELCLRRGGRITGRVVDALGTGLPGRDVNLYGAATQDATSDAAGRFAFENLPGGSYYLSSAATPEEIARFAPAESQDVYSILGRDARVELEELGSAEVILAPPVLRPVRMHGRVTSSGQPLAGARLLARGTAGVTSILAGPDGIYELVLPSPGTYGIQLDFGRTGMQSSVDVEVPAVERFAFDIEIATGGITGIVEDPEGRPVAGVQVRATLVGEERDWGYSGETTTGWDGSFRLEVPSGTHDVVAGLRNPWSESAGSLAPGWARGIAVAPGSPATGLQIRLGLGGSIEGTVEVQGGGSLSRTWVRVADAEGLDAGQTMVDAAGSFRLEGVPPGRARVQSFDQQERVSASTAVEVRAEETTRVALALSRGTDLKARIVDASGNLLEVEVVELLDPAGEVIATGSREADGTYELDTVPAGKHRVRAQHLGKTCEQEVVAGGGELTVDLTIE